MADEPAWIGLGSNLGDGIQLLTEAWRRLDELPGIKTEVISSPWRSAPVEMESDNWFTNAVGRIRTGLSPEEVLHALKVVEIDFGRVSHPEVPGYEDRTLDLDLLYWGEKGGGLLKTAQLLVPHPRAAERLFVLLPLDEIEPTLVDPQTGRSIAVMADEMLKREGCEKPQIRRWKES